MRSLRIFEVLEDTTNFSLPANLTWRRNLYEPLVEMGHEVFLLSAVEGRRAMQTHDRTGRSAFSEKLLSLVKAQHARAPLDLFFAYLMDGMVDPEAIDEIRKIGIPTCNFSCNNAHQFHLVDEISPHFDYSLHAEKLTAEKFRKVGARPIWWPMASNPNYFYPHQVERDIQVSFVGANYALRAQYVLHLLANGVDVHAFGPSWVSDWRAMLKRYKLALSATMNVSPKSFYRMSANLADQDLQVFLTSNFPLNVHQPISDEELVRLYSRSEVSLGFLEVYDKHDPSRSVIQHLHLREFEAPMSGALYCTGFSEELSEMFEPDKEVLVYRSKHELLDKINFTLKHPTFADKIRLAGRSRALRDHTYQRRFRDLFERIGLWH